MSEHYVTHLVVVDSGATRPVGVVSTLDIARALASW
jgi:CBS domain-containing protein